MFKHLREVLNLEAMRHWLPPLEDMAREVRSMLAATDALAIDRAIAARRSLAAAEFAVRQEADGYLGLEPEGPAFRALREAGLATLDCETPVFHGTASRRKEIADAARDKAKADLEMARAAVAAAPMPEQEMRTKHRQLVHAKLPGLANLLAVLIADLEKHGATIARPLTQEAPKYGPRWGSHPPLYWTGASACDALARLTTDVLESIQAGVELDMLFDDEVWERLRIDVVRECGELARSLKVELQNEPPTSREVLEPAATADVAPDVARVIQEMAAPVVQAPPKGAAAVAQPKEVLTVLAKDYARLRIGDREAMVRGDQNVWLVQRAWELGGRLIPWTDLLKAKLEWNGELDACRAKAKARAVDGSETDGARGAGLIASSQSLQRACRRLAAAVNRAIGADVLTTEGGWMMAES